MSDESEFIPRDFEEEGSANAKALVHPDSIMPDTLQIIPLKDRPYFPVLIQPLVVNQEPWGPGLKIVSESLTNWLGSVLPPI